MFKVPCTRCLNDKGYISAYRHVKGGVCFKCDGKGYTLVKTDPAKLAKAKEKREAKAKAERKERELKAAALWEELKSKYQDDPRLGPKARESCERSEAWAYDAYTLLARIDSGEYIHPLGPNMTE